MNEPEEPGQGADAGGDPRDDQPEVGSVGDEAAKLFGALSDWARDQGVEAAGGLGGGLAEGLGGLAAQAAATFHDVNEHLATGAPECTYCPVCRTVHLVRQTSPEVKAHLVTAASSLLQAAGTLLATQVPQDRGDRSSQVERIDLDDDGTEA